MPRKMFHIWDFTMFRTVQKHGCTFAQGLWLTLYKQCVEAGHCTSIILLINTTVLYKTWGHLYTSIRSICWFAFL